ncbi:hypothetical protein QMI71_004663 [Salmonella enterica]|nr:hypothetical protein [Salmonella enterica]
MTNAERCSKEKLYYRANKGNRTYRLTVIQDGPEYRLHYEQFEKAPSQDKNVKNTKRLVFEQTYSFTSLRDVNPVFLPFKDLTAKFCAFLKENNYEI